MHTATPRRRRSRLTERTTFRYGDEDARRLRRLSARRGEVESEVLRAGLEALEREGDQRGALEGICDLLRRGRALEALERAQALLSQ